MWVKIPKGQPGHPKIICHLRWGDVSQNEICWLWLAKAQTVISGEEMWVKILIIVNNKIRKNPSSPVRRCESKLEEREELVQKGRSSPVRRCESKWNRKGYGLGAGQVISGEEMWVKITLDNRTRPHHKRHLRWGDVSQNHKNHRCPKGHHNVISGEEMWVKMCRRAETYRRRGSSPVRRCESKFLTQRKILDVKTVISGEEMWVKINKSFWHGQNAEVISGEEMWVKISVLTVWE